jgi:cell wall-associated protease
MKRTIISLLLILFCAFGYSQNAQTTVPRDWHMLDFQQDHIYGISVDKAYQDLLKNMKSTPVVVAIIDSGIDTLQEDLKPVLWHNPIEKNNGLDNDKDGYVGDYYGWNFIGSKDPNKNVTKDTEECLRIYYKYKDRFSAITSEDQLSKKDRPLYREWLRTKPFVLQSTPEQKSVNMYTSMQKFLNENNPVIQKELNKPVYTISDIKAYRPIDEQEMVSKRNLMTMFRILGPDSTNVMLNNRLSYLIDSLKVLVKMPETKPLDYRDSIVGDNYANFNDRYYGNNNVMAGDHRHGTHVAGIIGAVRNNGVGMNGIADNVKIMMIRAVPDGDEHDKDIAESIRFAVDHGAKIINMSFGKPFSPEQKWVEDAFKYAAKKDVLIVKAAGNDGKDIDTVASYPTTRYLKGNKLMPNVLTIGASGPLMSGLIAPFSNYGKTMVDVFAPGVRIYSTVPGVSNYAAMSGTSMASPVVAGLAALLKSYFPKLTAVQIKKVIEDSVTKISEPVRKPGSSEMVPMTDLCKSGGIVNAYNAVKLAETIK